MESARGAAMDGLYGDLLNDTTSAGAGHAENRLLGDGGDLLDGKAAGGAARGGDVRLQNTRDRSRAQFDKDRSHQNVGKRRRQSDTDRGFHCAVCAEFVQQGSRAEHERGTLHRFNLFAEQPHDDRISQAAGELAAVRARDAAASEAAAVQSEAARLASQRQSKGYKMLKLAGWTEGAGLGLRGDGVTAPVPTRLVRGRPGIERHLAQPARVTHRPRIISTAPRQKDTPKAPGTRGERRAARNVAANVVKREEDMMRDELSLGEETCDGNTGPLWRATHI